MTLDEIEALCVCLSPAHDPTMMEIDYGPAHELAHALIADPWRRNVPFFGLGVPPLVSNATGLDWPQMADVDADHEEDEATIISALWLDAAGALDERDHLLIDGSPSPSDEGKAIARLRRRGLWPPPMTVDGIERHFAKGVSP